MTATTSQPIASTRLDLSHLNGAQREAVETTEGPLLVLAGAGTGKTRVLTTRIAHILARGLAFPSQILSVTFTNKAAKEMQLRVADMVGDQAAGVWLGTFHSTCLRMLRRDADKIGLPSDFTVIDMDDQIRLLKQLMRDHEMDEKALPPAAASVVIQRWKDRVLSPAQVVESEGETPASKLYELYQERLLQLGMADFGDLLMHAITLLRDYPDVLAHYHRRFRYILVDEYQDTNVAQYLWLRLLASDHRNLCCVGDDDQSIYGWRGAEVGNILRFEQDFSTQEQPAQIIRLEQNYRSTGHILAAASAVIANNEERLGKTLFCEDEDGEKIRIVSLWDERTEAGYVAQEIEAKQQLHDTSLDDIAVLVRAGHQTRAFEEAFMSANIPYRIIGGLRFYERKEIRDAIAYIRLLVQPANDLAFERIINVPKRGVGASTLDKLREYSRTHSVSLHRSVRDLTAQGEIKGKAGNQLSELLKALEYWKELLHEKAHPEVVELMLEQSGYLPMWKNSKSAEAPGRVDNLKELISALAEFSSLESFLEHVSLVADGDEAPDGEMVSVMTMHAAKGLEFDHVFLGGWEEGLFPSQRAMDENGQAGLEEERRLAYVGITRARKYLTISFAANRFVFGQTMSSIPSRFIDELPDEHIERINTGLGPGYGASSKPRLGALGSPPPNLPPQAGGGVSSTSQPLQAGGGVSSNLPPVYGGDRGGSETPPNFAYKQSSAFTTGARVFHQKFGYGVVMSADGEHITVDFEKSSTRTLMADYLDKA